MNRRWLVCVYCLFFYFFAGAQAMQPTPAPQRLQSIAAKREMIRNSSFQTAFRNIGPTAMSGRVVDIDVNPERPIEFYVAYATGGLWYTHNNGQSFVSVLDSADVLFLGDVTVHWPSGNIWIGTGEANASRSTYAGTGVYKSADKGKTWQHAGLSESHHIGKILIHPANPDVVWVASTGHLYTPNEERGIYKTIDGGKTWNRVLFVNNMTGGIDMDINASNPDELYACMWQKSRRAWNFEENGAGSGIYKSVDGGLKWVKLNTAGSGLPAGDTLGRCGIAVSASNPRVLYLLADNQGQVILPERKDTLATKAKYQLNDFRKITREEFALLDENKLDSFLKDNRLSSRYKAKEVKEWVASGKIKPNALFVYIMGDENPPASPRGSEIYRSEDAGETWTKSTDRTISNLYGPIGYYFGRIAVSPANDKKIVALGIPIMFSTDGGKTFKIISKGNTHADHHAVWFNPADDKHFIIGNDGGINITYDNGATWFHANSPAVGQHYTVSVDNSRPYKVYTGLQDNGVWYGPSQGLSSGDFADPKGFRRLGGGDGMMVLADPRDNKTVYLGSQFGSYSRTHIDTGGYLSVKPLAELGDEPLRFNWLTPILMSRHLPDVFYIGGNKLYRSFDKGRDLKAISPDLTQGKKAGNVPFGTITALDESPLRFGLLYVGTDDGNVQVSKDVGGSWKGIDAKLPKGLWVSRVVASAHAEGRVFVTLNGYRDDHFAPYVFVSEDYGENWKPISKGLPVECVNVIREDPWTDSVLYVGTDGGCYVSKDRGATWQIWQKGLPVSVPVYDIAIHKKQNDIVLATHGRSIYVASLNSINGVKGEVIQANRPRQIVEE